MSFARKAKRNRQGRRMSRCLECGRHFATDGTERICDECRTCRFCGVLPGNASILGWTCAGCFRLSYALRDALVFLKSPGV